MIKHFPLSKPILLFIHTLILWLASQSDIVNMQPIFSIAFRAIRYAVIGLFRDVGNPL